MDDKTIRKYYLPPKVTTVKFKVELGTGASGGESTFELPSLMDYNSVNNNSDKFWGGNDNNNSSTTDYNPFGGESGWTW